jgi:hypothetical protein
MLHYQRSLLYCFSALSELSPEELGGLEGALKKIGKRAAALVEQGAGESAPRSSRQIERLRDYGVARRTSVPIKVPSGLIHDWTVATFVPGVTLIEVLQVVRNCLPTSQT